MKNPLGCDQGTNIVEGKLMISNALHQQIETNNKLTVKNESVSADKILSQENSDFKSLFSIQTANKWLDEAKTRPAPKMLFDEFWYEGELCILFADTNVGKSILATQIADAIGNGRNIDNLQVEIKPQPIIYFDFELSDKQFEARYSVKNDEYFTNHFVFSDNLYRAEINPNNFLPTAFADFEEYLNFSIKEAIAETGSRILIIDNLTYLRRETEKARDALPLMKELKQLKNRFDLSILALAHTPKRDLSKPISRNDLQGSKMLINFCDSSFSIGESIKDKSLRYLKQIKVRNTEALYTTENVLLCQIAKQENFLHFEFLETGTEMEHLRNLSEADRADFIKRAKELSALGSSQRAIAVELGMSAMTVNRYLKKA